MSWGFGLKTKATLPIKRPICAILSFLLPILVFDRVDAIFRFLFQNGNSVLQLLTFSPMFIRHSGLKMFLDISTFLGIFKPHLCWSSLSKLVFPFLNLSWSEPKKTKKMKWFEWMEVFCFAVHWSNVILKIRLIFFAFTTNFDVFWNVLKIIVAQIFELFATDRFFAAWEILADL